MKLKRKGIKKFFDGDTYIFKGGKAIIPGCRFQGQPMIITLSEFNEITKELKNAKKKKRTN